MKRDNKKWIKRVFPLFVVLILGFIIWLIYSQNITVNRKSTPKESKVATTEFSNEKAIDYIYNKLQQVNSNISKETVSFIIEKEWEYQYANAPKTKDNITLISRSDEKLINYLVTETNKSGHAINSEEVKLIINYLEDYEDFL